MPKITLFNRPPAKAKSAPKSKPPPTHPDVSPEPLPPPGTTVPKPGRNLPTPLPPEPEPSINGNGRNNHGPGRPDFFNEYMPSIFCHCDRPLVFATPIVSYEANEVITCSRCGKRVR